MPHPLEARPARRFALDSPAARSVGQASVPIDAAHFCRIRRAPSVSGDTPRLGYDIGYSFFEWLRVTSGGLDAHATIMALLGEDVPFFDALEQALGRTTTEIERDWRLWLGASADAPTLVPTWTPPPFLTPPTPMQFGN